jgi:hypothetical protein
MHWRRDHTGRFPECPYYLPEELEEICEDLIAVFLRSRHGTVEFPVATDDLTVFVEQAGAALDQYADLSAYEGTVQGVTEFVSGRKPLVRIARRLSENPRYQNRLRTTLAHEFGHVRFHGPLYRAQWAVGQLFAGGPPMGLVCRVETVVGAPAADWAEWQAPPVAFRPTNTRALRRVDV